MKCSCCWFRSLQSGLGAACPVASDASSQRKSRTNLDSMGGHVNVNLTEGCGRPARLCLSGPLTFFHHTQPVTAITDFQPDRRDKYSLTCSRREVCQSPKTALEADPSPVKEVTDARATRRTAVSPRQDERRQWGVAHCRRKRHGNPERSKSSCRNRAGTSRTA